MKTITRFARPECLGDAIALGVAITAHAFGVGAMAHAQEPVQVEWVVDQSGVWHAAPNWSTGVAPKSGEDVLINRPMADVTVTHTAESGTSLLNNLTCTETLGMEGGTMVVFSAAVDTLRVAGGSMLHFGVSSVGTLDMQAGLLGGLVFNSRLGVTGPATWAGGMIQFSVGLVSVEGPLHLAGAATKSLNGTLSGSHDITWSGGGAIALESESMLRVMPSGRMEIRDAGVIEDTSSSAFLRNEGELRNVAAGSTTVRARLVNFGTLRLEAGTIECLGTFTQYGGETSLEGGTISSPEPLELLGGVLTGSGALGGDLTNEATVSPGNAIGSLTISNYVQTGGGVLLIELAGPGPTEVDHVVVQETATLAGELRIALVDGYVPRVGDSFEIMHYGSGLGRFDRVSWENLPPNMELYPILADDRVAVVAVEPSVWVDFAYPPGGRGTFDDPYETLAAGVGAVDPGGDLTIKSGASGETATITKAMTIKAFGGGVVIGE